MKPRDPPWLPAPYEVADIDAMKALAAGTATDFQQRQAVNWIVNIAALTYDEPFRSDADGGERSTSFALGKAHVGRQVMKLVNMPPDLVAKMRTKNG